MYSKSISLLVLSFTLLSIQPVCAASSQLEGSWERSCHLADPSDPDSHYDIVRLNFSGSLFNSDIKNFKDDNCKIPHKYAPNPTAAGNFKIGVTFIDSNAKTVTEIDTLITTFNGSPFEIRQYQVFLIENDKLYFSVQNDSEEIPNAKDRMRDVDLSNYFSAL